MSLINEEKERIKERKEVTEKVKVGGSICGLFLVEEKDVDRGGQKGKGKQKGKSKGKKGGGKPKGQGKSKNKVPGSCSGNAGRSVQQVQQSNSSSSTHKFLLPTIRHQFILVQLLVL